MKNVINFGETIFIFNVIIAIAKIIISSSKYMNIYNHIYNSATPKDTPESANILVNKTGKKAEQGNSITVTIIAKSIIAQNKIIRFVFSWNIFLIFGTKRDIKLF